MGKKNKKRGKVQYPHAKIALEEMQIAYQVENERKRTLDAKAGAFIMVDIAILTIYIPLLPFAQMISFFQQASTYRKVGAIISLAALAVGIVCLIGAFIWLARGYSNKQYQYLNVDSILTMSNSMEYYDKGTVETGMVSHYHKILRGTIDEPGNMKLNEDRARLIQRGITTTVVGFGFISLATIAVRIIIGG